MGDAIRMGPLALDRIVREMYEWRDGDLRKRKRPEICEEQTRRRYGGEG